MKRIFKMRVLLLLLINFVIFQSLFSEDLVVKIRPFVEQNIDITKEYKYMLLDLILSKTEATDGPYQIELSDLEQLQSRTIQRVKDGKISLIMTMTSKIREEELFPIRIPIYKGLIGYRIFIINRKDKARFNSIDSLSELRELKAGQGHDWPDVEILRHNRIPVETGGKFSNLILMLQNDRFDYFPRGLPEPWREVESYNVQDLIVDDHLMIYYPAPFYIFIARNNQKLIDRIKRGFSLAIDDGSFDQLFNTHPYIQNAITMAKMDQRLIFRFDNPLLSTETPLEKTEYWYVLD